MQIYTFEKQEDELKNVFTPMLLCEDTIIKLMKEDRPPKILQAELAFLIGQLFSVHLNNPYINSREIAYRYDNREWTNNKAFIHWLFNSAMDAGIIDDDIDPEYSCLDPIITPTYFPSDERFEEWYSNARYRYEGLFAINNGKMKEGLDIFKKSEEVFCLRELAMSYFKGKGIQINQEEGIYWQKKAAEIYGGQDELRLALLYYSAENDYKKEALQIFKKYSLQGDSYAQYMYGCMLLEGHGIEEDEDASEGQRWIKIAAKNGNEDAQEYLKEAEDYYKQHKNIFDMLLGEDAPSILNEFFGIEIEDDMI